ncbi:hypothetical protein OC844_002544 [Tilletia horrida]|nr:hypothetical protein OC844_002544 [Tilletia horrida]
MPVIQGATSPQGWSVSGTVVWKAAALAELAVREVDVSAECKALRRDSINKVRRDCCILSKEGKILKCGIYDDASRTAELPDSELDWFVRACAEARIIRAMIESWPDDDQSSHGAQPEAQTTLPGPPPSIGQAPPGQASQQADLRRRAPASVEDDPPAKRARTDAGSNACPVDASAPTASDACTSRIDGSSAAHRFFNLPELLAVLLDARLRFDKIDLISLSKVSKRVRALVLPFLVESVNVRLTRVGQLATYFANNPGLIEHVKYLRIWDEVAHYHAHYEGSLTPDQLSDFRNQKTPKLHQRTWSNLSILLTSIEKMKRREPPLFELSIGQQHLSEFYEELRRSRRVLEQLASLRIVGDFGPSWYKGMTRRSAESIFSNHGTAVSEDLETLLRLICEAQDDAGSDAFHTFTFTAFFFREDRSGSVLPSLRPRLLQRLAARIRHLHLEIGTSNTADACALETILGLYWQRLNSFGFHSILIEDAPDQTRIRNAINAFLQRHQQLKHTAIDIEMEAEFGGGRPYWIGAPLPRLESCQLSLSWVDDEDRIAFPGRHPRLQALSTSSGGDLTAFARHPNLAKSLKKLRADENLIRSIVQAGVPLRHLSVATVNDFCWIHTFLADYPTPSTSITCIEIETVSNEVYSLLEDSYHFSMLDHVPRLTEFTLKSIYEEEADEPETPSESASSLAKLLSNLAIHAKQLRALRVHYDAAADLPPDDELATVIGDIPPKLEYVIWHVPFDDITMHFRVVRPVSSSATPVQAQATAGTAIISERARSKQRAGASTAAVDDGDNAKPRLQRLPAMFRPCVDRRTGVWEDLSDPSAFTLFDHMGEQPRLKYL